MSRRRKCRRKHRPLRDVPRVGRTATVVIDGAAVRVRVLELVAEARALCWRFDLRQKVESPIADLW